MRPLARATASVAIVAFFLVPLPRSLSLPLFLLSLPLSLSLLRQASISRTFLPVCAFLLPFLRLYQQRRTRPSILVHLAESDALFPRNFLFSRPIPARAEPAP